jgi:hypothetical protein
MAIADQILSEVYENLELNDADDMIKYNSIGQIVQRLSQRNQQNKIHEKTTGTISERLCELALRSKVDGIYRRVTNEWNWMADFSILGHPFNLLISVKSFKAKERLLVSGSGNILSPTVGWGLFDDPSEWTESRTRLYLFRAFIAIYMPTQLYDQIAEASKAVRNINGKPFLRRVDDFMNDLTIATPNNVIDITSF